MENGVDIYGGVGGKVGHTAFGDRGISGSSDTTVFNRPNIVIAR
jgi:hypothetical protein